MKKKLVIFGTGQFAEVADFYFTEYSDYEVAGFTSDKPEEDEFLGRLLVPFSTAIYTFPTDIYEMYIAIAYSDRNRARERKYLEAREKKYQMASFVHPHNCIASNVRMGQHCFIFENQTIQPFVTIGDNVILWSGNHIGHHSRIESHVFIASHVVVSGSCIIGARSFLGVNSTLHDGVAIAHDCIIGAGARVDKDITEDGTVLLGPKSTRKEIVE